MADKRIFSGIQPSGNLHIGNYLGAIRQWVDLQESHDALFCIVDLHAITVPQNPVELRKKTMEIAKIYLASGIDPTKSTLFVQSQVPAHSELMWILNTIVTTGELHRMTQFKDKSGVSVFKNQLRELLQKHINPKTGSIQLEADIEYWIKRFTEGSITYIDTGLFTYPVLMAADILLYDTNVVPVGKDQLQHVELARTLARRFNEKFGETFVIPEGKLSKEGALIMGLDDPTKKMSKSAASEYNYIALNDTPDQVRKKIMKAVTDSGSEIAYGDEKPALKNLINIYSLLSGKSIDEVVALYTGKGPDSAKASTGTYGAFKKDLAEVVVGFLEPFQTRLAALDDDAVMKILADGKSKAEALAEKKLLEVKQKVGFLS